MKRIRIVILVVCLLLGGCTQEKKTSQTVFAMDTVMELTVWGAQCEEAATELESLITDLEGKWSAHGCDTILSALNGGYSLPKEKDQAFVEQVQALSRRTGGAFDPQLSSLMALWGFPAKQYHVPTEAEIAQAMEVKHWDLGGAVKGYAGDLAVEMLKEMDVDRAILNLGGNIQTYGRKADGTPWSIGIQNPKGGQYLGVVAVEGTMAVVTSGDYQRYFEQDGVRYHHILDPKTGSPARSGLVSVTVICKSGLTADALSTALFVMGLEEAAEFWRGSEDFEAVFVTAEGQIFATEGAKLSGCKFEVIHREN